MSLNIEDKKAVVADVSGYVNKAQAIVVAEYRGLPVAEMTKLRAQARHAGVYFRIVKNTLVRRAVADTPFAGLTDHITPWRDGGKTIAANCQMLCKDDNRIKSAT